MPEHEREKIRHLLVVKDLQGQRTIPLQDATYSLGRDSRNAIVLRSRSVSRQHAILLRVTIPETDQYGFRIIDGDFKGKKVLMAYLSMATNASRIICKMEM